jgi:hypothetical protein
LEAAEEKAVVAGPVGSKTGELAAATVDQGPSEDAEA